MSSVNAEHRGLFPESGYEMVLTTQNPQKTATSKAIISRFFGLGRVKEVKPVELCTPTQPVGDDIEWGARSRIDLVSATLPKLNSDARLMVSVENGLLVATDSPNKEVADLACVCLEILGQRYYGESTAVPVRVHGEPVGLVTEEILEYLNHDLAGYNFTSRYEQLNPAQQRVFNLMVFGHENGPDDSDKTGQPQVAGFRQRVIEALQAKGVKDYWEEYSNGTLSRDKGVAQALKAAINQFINSQRGQARLALAHTFKQSLIAQGLPASLGGRYGQTVWMRDFGIMINTLNHSDMVRPGAYSALLESLKTIADHQHDNGLVPQVVIPDQLLSEFVYLRILGGDSGESWYAQLQTFLQANYPDLATQLPALEAKNLKALPLAVLKQRIEELKTLYRTLSTKATEDGLALPKPSHTLRGFLTDTLATLTPGTTDSEIHFIRSITTLLAVASSDEQVAQIKAMVPNLARALVYLDRQVLDPGTGLPQGGDNRDMLDSYLCQKLLCSNACFLYQGFCQLVRSCAVIGPELRAAVREHFPADQLPASGFIRALMAGDTALESTLAKLGRQIRNTFIYPDGVFAPRDFVDSDHRVTRQPIRPDAYIIPLVEQNDAFLQGREVNLQGLALAIELGLVDQADHPAAVELIHTQLTCAGLKVFSPINMASEYEIGLLQQSQGFLVWPQIECRVIHVLKECMDETPAIRELLAELDHIHKERPGFREWYNTSGLSGVHSGGAQNQSWHITSLVQV